MTSAMRLPITIFYNTSREISCLITKFQRCMSTRKKFKIPFRMEVQGLDPQNYTHKAIPYPKSGGRGVDGRVYNRRQSGGKKIKYLMVDTTRPTNKLESEEPISEMVLRIQEDSLRTAHVALVGKGDHKRWIICPDGAKPGTVINSYGHIPINPVQAKKGDSYRLGALPMGTVIHNVEKQPDEGGIIARAAGTSAVLLRKIEGSCVVQMPSGQEILLDEKCIGTVGKASNSEYDKRHIGSPNNMRWQGIKQRSGLHKRKVGYNGKKVKKMTPAITFEKTSKATHELFED